MSAMPIQIDRTVASPAQREPRPASSWIPIDAAAEALGLTSGQLRRLCKDLAPRNQARRMPGPKGRVVWHIHAGYHPRLIRVAAGASTPAEAATASDIVKLATDKQREAAMQRFECVRRFVAWRQRDGVEVVRDFPALASELERDIGLKPSLRTLYLWAGACQSIDDAAACIAALIDQRGGPGGAGGRGEDVSPDAWRAFEQLYLDPRKWSIAKCHRTVKARAKSEGWAWPSLRTVQLLVSRRIDPSVSVYHREGREVWSRRFETPIEQAPDAYAPGECWEADHTRLDFFVRVQRGGRWVAARPWITAWLDRRSRRLMGWHMSESANSDTIRAALLDALRDDEFGPPRAAWLDNGKDFDSAAITGVTKAERRRGNGGGGGDGDNAAAWSGLLGMLGIEPRFALPYNHNGKARIERMFGTLHMEFDREFASWCGSKPGDRDRETLDAVLADVMALPTMDEARERFVKWAQWYNARSEHSIEDLADPDTGERLSPDAFLRRLAPTRRMLPDRGVLALLAQRWSRPLKVHKWGVSLTHKGKTYRYGEHRPELESYVGSDRRVLVSFDPGDVAVIRVFDEMGRYLCDARMNAQHGGLSSTPISQEALKRAHEARRAQRRRMEQRVDWTAHLSDDAELAAIKQREIDIEAEKARQRELGIDADSSPALRIIRTPLDGQSEGVERQQARKAVGSDFVGDDDDKDGIDLAELRLTGRDDADGDDSWGGEWGDEIDLADAEAPEVEDPDEDDDAWCADDASAFGEECDDLDVIGELS